MSDTAKADADATGRRAPGKRTGAALFGDGGREPKRPASAGGGNARGVDATGGAARNNSAEKLHPVVSGSEKSGEDVGETKTHHGEESSVRASAENSSSCDDTSQPRSDDRMGVGTRCAGRDGDGDMGLGPIDGGGAAAPAAERTAMPAGEHGLESPTPSLSAAAVAAAAPFCLAAQTMGMPIVRKSPIEEEAIAARPRSNSRKKFAARKDGGDGGCKLRRKSDASLADDSASASASPADAKSSKLSLDLNFSVGSRGNGGDGRFALPGQSDGSYGGPATPRSLARDSVTQSLTAAMIASPGTARGCARLKGGGGESTAARDCGGDGAEGAGSAGTPPIEVLLTRPRSDSRISFAADTVLDHHHGWSGGSSTVAAVAHDNDAEASSSLDASSGGDAAKCRGLSLDLNLAMDSGVDHLGLGSLDGGAATPRSQGGGSGTSRVGSSPLVTVMVASPSASSHVVAPPVEAGSGDGGGNAVPPLLPPKSLAPFRKRKWSIDIMIPDSHGSGSDNELASKVVKAGDGSSEVSSSKASSREVGTKGKSCGVVAVKREEDVVSTSHKSVERGECSAPEKQDADVEKSQHICGDNASAVPLQPAADTVAALATVIPRRKHGFSFDATFDDSVSVNSTASRASIHHLPIDSKQHGSSHVPPRKRNMSLDISLPSSDGGMPEPQQHMPQHYHLPPPGQRNQPLKKRGLSVDLDYNDLCSIPDASKSDDVVRLTAGAGVSRENSGATKVKKERLEGAGNHRPRTSALDHLDALGDHAHEHQQHQHADQQYHESNPATTVDRNRSKPLSSASRSRGLSVGGMSAGPPRKRKLSLDLSLPSSDDAGAMGVSGLHGIIASTPRSSVEMNMGIEKLIASRKSSDADRSSFSGSAVPGRKASDEDRSGVGGSGARPGRKSSDGDHSGHSKDGLIIVTGGAAEATIPKPGRKSSDGDHSGGSGSTLGPANQRLLLEALLHDKEVARNRNRAESWGGMSDLSVAGAAHQEISDAAAAIATASALHSTGLLEDITAAADEVIKGTITPGCGHSLDGGGILGLSGGSSSSVDHNAAAVAAAAALSAPDAPALPGKEIELVVPSKPRKDSIASLSSASVGGSLTSFELKPKSPESQLVAKSTPGQPGSDGLDVQAIIATAMNTVSGQLEEIATAAEMASGDTSSVASRMSYGSGGRKNSADLVADAVAAAAVDANIDYASIAGMAAAVTRKTPTGAIKMPTGAAKMPPRAAKIPTGVVKMPTGSVKKPTGTVYPASVAGVKKPPPPAPPPPLPPIPPNNTAGRDMEAIRARARAAAGYVPPGTAGAPPLTPASKKQTPSKAPSNPRLHTPPVKKRPKKVPAFGTPPASMESALGAVRPGRVPGIIGVPPPNPASYSTPQMSNRKRPVPGAHLAPRHKGTPQAVSPHYAHATPASVRSTPRTPASASSSSSQANQKWEEMFDALTRYIAERKEEECSGLTEEEKKGWKWEGNVPTTYKTKDGKALGRWINNQRSAKNKGSLKRDREVRLVEAGLKWSVLSTNAWPDMLQELKAYVEEKTKDGQPWDGNVPTNYRIKSSAAVAGSELDEDKNLGRWINRQRSLYQAGKLKKHRQLELEKIGLKWSVLSTVSWDDMYDSLCAYAAVKRAADPQRHWDGNVPANHKTEDDPPRSLGRWVNRQRCAYAKNKLKADLVAKLEQLGLKWCVHEKKSAERAATINAAQMLGGGQGRAAESVNAATASGRPI